MPEEIVRNCHSDLRLHMSANSFAQLNYMISFAVKFARLIEGENSHEYKTAVHWKSQFDKVEEDFHKTFDGENHLSFLLHTYFD